MQVTVLKHYKFKHSFKGLWERAAIVVVVKLVGKWRNRLNKIDFSSDNRLDQLFHISAAKSNMQVTVLKHHKFKHSFKGLWEQAEIVVVVKLVSKWYERDSIKLTLSINQICIVVRNKEQKRVKTWKVVVQR